MILLLLLLNILYKRLLPLRSYMYMCVHNRLRTRKQELAIQMNAIDDEVTTGNNITKSELFCLFVSQDE